MASAPRSSASWRTARSMGSRCGPPSSGRRRAAGPPCPLAYRPVGVGLPGGAVAPQGGDLHLVLGQGAGLVDAQHADRAQGLDRGGAAHQHPVTRQPPGAQRQEDRQHHGELFGHHGDGDGDPRQDAADPVVAGQAVGDPRRDTDAKAPGPPTQASPAGSCVFCSGLGSSWMAASDRPIRPSRVSPPVRTTTPVPCPRVISEPANSNGRPSPPGSGSRSGGAVPPVGCLETGADSPVRADSSTLRGCRRRSGPRRRAGAGPRPPGSRRRAPGARPGCAPRGPRGSTCAKGSASS